jgi:hypothetical protein
MSSADRMEILTRLYQSFTFEAESLSLWRGRRRAVSQNKGNYMLLTKTAAAAALGAALLIGGAASASAYTMDASGVGWVGKGEVQTAYGWNNKSMQTNVGGVTFVYDASATFTVTCEFDTPGGNHHVITQTKSTDVNATVSSDARNNSNGKDGPMTGWYLTGFGTTTTQGPAVPAVGDGCPGNSGLGAVTSVEQTGSGDGGLYAVWNGQRKLLTLTVVTTTL